MRRPHPRAWRPRARASPRLSRRRRRAPRRLAPHRHPRRLSSARAQVSLEGMAAHSMAELRQEISVQKMLDHPNIVKVFETFEDPRRQELHIIMEMCTGGALVSRMKTHRHGYGEKAAATLLEKSLSATMYCHKHGVVHRDIKLDNFIYENEAEDAELKLIDFGFASFVAPGKESMWDQIGTPSYMAPELWSERQKARAPAPPPPPPPPPPPTLT